MKKESTQSGLDLCHCPQLSSTPIGHRAQLCTLPGTKHGFLSLLFLASLVAERKDLILDQVFPPAGLDTVPVDGP